MSTLSKKIIQASAGNAGETATYVEDVFSTYLYEGIQPTEKTVDNGIDLDGEGGLVWIKKRNDTGQHELFDTERGATKTLRSNLSNAEATRLESLKSFNSNGFTVGNDTVVNNTGTDFVSWTFRKQAGFFDVVTYTGNGSPGVTRTLSHNLGSVPGMIIVKSTTQTANWAVYHRGMDASNPENYSAYLDVTNARAISDLFGSTAPTATEFTVGWDGDVNTNGQGYIAYLFAHDAQDFGTDSDESIIKCDTYEGNGGTKEITLGWEPQWILSKNIDDNTNNWMLMDTMRGAPVDGDTLFIEPNTNATEAVGSNPTKWYPTSTGFKVEQGANGVNDTNESGETYIYVAIRRPQKPASEFAATDLFDDFKYKDNTLVQTDNPIQLTSERQTGGPAVLTDMWWHALRGTTYPAGKSNSFFIGSRLQGAGKGMVTDGTNAEPAGDASELKGYDRMTGVEVGPNGTFYYSSTAAGNRDHISYYLRRAPGFFDVVAYDGTGSAHNISHNLGVAPELMILKQRDGVGNWLVYSKPTTAQKYSFLHTTQAFVDDSDSPLYFDDTEPTSTTFRVGTGLAVNQNNKDHIAYLFATVPGISKVGSYSGTGSNVDVDCGFSAGARFVLVKRTDSTGDWYVWDSVRGIVAGNDPYLLLNSTAAEVTSTDYIDPLSSGFTITSTAPAALNASGGTYIFLAIA